MVWDLQTFRGGMKRFIKTETNQWILLSKEKYYSYVGFLRDTTGRGVKGTEPTHSLLPTSKWLSGRRPTGDRWTDLRLPE